MDREKSSKECPVCHLPQKDQHSLRESAVCDGIRKGYLSKDAQKTAKKG